MRLFLFLLFFSSCCFAENATVEADTARYDGSKIYLDGHVTIIHLLGKMTAEKAVVVRDTACPFDFPYVELSENVVATLTRHGELRCGRIDYDYHTLQSKVMGNPEIHYSDDKGEIIAREGTIHYQQCDGKYSVAKIILFGDVKMKNKASQYALADVLEYHPQDETLILRGKEKGKVLFFDKAKGMELSAKEVIAHGKESIQGVGEVSFVFSGEEISKIKTGIDQWFS